MLTLAIFLDPIPLVLSFYGVFYQSFLNLEDKFIASDGFENFDLQVHLVCGDGCHVGLPTKRIVYLILLPFHMLDIKF